MSDLSALMAYAKKCQIHLNQPPTIQQPIDIFGIKAWIEEVNQRIDDRLLHLKQDGWREIRQLIMLRTLAVDVVLISLFQAAQFPSDFALFAVGGYGRSELLPHSDVDILLIGDNPIASTEIIEQFVAHLWDIGITPSFSVRNLQETKQAVKEQTIATALLEARLLSGNQQLSSFPYQTVKSAWTISDFFDTKMLEAKQRHISQNSTEYNLEPNLKNALGALRDIHIIGWIGRFYFQANSLEQLTDVGYIHKKELQDIKQAQEFLWCLRHHLHMSTARAEDRLLFEHQIAVAHRFGYCDNLTFHPKSTQALEVMMRQYYRYAMRIAAFSEMLCNYFQERYLDQNIIRQPIDDDFYLLHRSQDTILTQVGVKIAVHHLDAFIKNPSLLLKIFLIMGQKGVKQVAASTLRLIYTNSHLIDDEFRQNTQCQQLFLANLQQSDYLFHRLRLMARYGVLGNYLPAFGKIIGLMQYDLFHRYTVDAHTLLLIRILHRFGDPKNLKEYDLVAQIYNNIARKDILVIAALFHDIAKGRGGNHSQLGAVDAYDFCRTHGLSKQDSQFIQWLVLEHLTMSLTAQKQDISDPDVIAKFAQFTKTITRLNYLYVLTVADMNATNTQLWNTWRASLLKQLYINTHRALSLGYINADKASIIQNRKEKARSLLSKIDPEQLRHLWKNFGEDYFLKQKHADIAWQSSQIIEKKHILQSGEPIIALQAHTDLSLGGIQLLVCTPNQANLFAKTVCVLDRLGLSVLDANILTVTIDSISVAIDMYVLIDRLNVHDPLNILSNLQRQADVIHTLTHALKNNHQPINIYTPATHKLKHFNVPTQVSFKQATTLAHQGCHQMHLVTKDCPALLAKIGGIFYQQSIEVHGARITTLGERAEDVFYISGMNNQTLSEDELNNLKQTIINTFG